MPTRTASVACSLTLGVLCLLALQLGVGQEPTASPPPAAPKPPVDPPSRVIRDAARLGPLQRQTYLALSRGADWLARSNRVDGHFDYGLAPDLRVRLEGDHYLRQAGAAFALARAARLTGNEKHTAVARQAVLTLLADTVVETEGGVAVRHTSLPAPVVNRLGAAGLLVLAINELPAPANDLLEQSEQLCQFIRRQQQTDGALACSDGDAPAEPDAANAYPGVALYGLMRSQQHRPADWKTDLLRKALTYYRPWWQKNKNMAFVPWQTAAYAEAFRTTREPVFAEFALEMSDWICALQYVTVDAQHPLWVGGFMSYADGRAVTAPPQVGSAAYAAGLAEAYRVARQTGDVARAQRYREAVERCLQFTTTLQYTDVTTQHFVDDYRALLLGGFHVSHQDGRLRIDDAQHALSALTQYLAFVAE